MEQDIKVVVFDFDNTLYSGVDWTTAWSEYCKKGLRQVFNELSDEEFEQLLKKENITKVSNFLTVTTILKYGKDVKKWLDYRNERSCEMDFSNAFKMPNEELYKFANKYTLYIVSNSVVKTIKEVSKYFDIDLSVFKKVIGNDYSHGITKKFFYEQIIKEENINSSQLFVIGDDEIVDIIPALELGANGKLIKDCTFTIEDLGL